MLYRRLIKYSFHYPAVFLHGKHPENDCFLFIKMRLTAGKHICSINLNAITEFRRFAAWETFYENDYIAGHNNRTCGMKQFFHLFGVAVNILQTEALGS